MRAQSQSGRMDREELIMALELAGVHGHGGAFFPTATKLRATAARRRRRPLVVVNGSEGEPLSRKDRFLLGSRTDIVLDGALAVAFALDAEAIVIAIDHRRVRSIEAVGRALAQRHELQDRRAPAVQVIPVPDGYVSGQETALLSFLNGHDPKPTSTPPYPFEKGLRGRSTFVSNVETFAQIGRVIAGTYDASRYVTVSGAVEKVAVVQVHPGTTVAGAFAAAGGLSEPVTAVLLGGYAGTWAPAPVGLELLLDERALRNESLTLGAGIIYGLGESRCGVAEVARVTRWMAEQSAGQCGPCVFGLRAIAGALSGLCLHDSGHASTSLAQIERWCQMVTGRGGCAHPDGVTRYVSSALRVMAPQFRDHALRGPCRLCDVESSQGVSLNPAPTRPATESTAVLA